MRIHDVQKTKASHTYNHLKSIVRKLELQTGTHLEVEILAKIFRSSVTPVREALSRLSCESLLEIQPNRGYFVPRVDLAEQLSLHEVGDVILSYACGHTIRWPIEFENEETSAEAYSDFLQAIVRAAGNPELNQMFLNVIDRTFGLVNIYLQDEEVRETLRCDISSVLKTRDPASGLAGVQNIRQRFAEELPRLVKVSGTRSGYSMTQLASIISRRQSEVSM